MDSTDYYNAEAQSYFDTTIGFDLKDLYDVFLPHISQGGLILDASCGSGRDTKYFLSQGYSVEAFDGAKNMADMASCHTGIPVAHKSFFDVSDVEKYDGIWTSASLLHVPKNQLGEVLGSLKNALKSGGVWYMSFRYGKDEHQEGSRYFNDQDESSLTSLIQDLGGLEILTLTVPETLKSRRGYSFVVAVVRKK